MGSVPEPTSVSTGSSQCNGRLIINPEIMASTNSLDPILPNDKEEEQPNANAIFILSKRRWLVLFTMATLDICMAISSNTSPILSLLLELLDLRDDQYVYFSQIFYYVSAFTSIPIAWFVDKYGIKRSILTAAALHLVTCLFRAALYSPSLPGWHKYKMFYWFIGSFFGSQYASLYFMLPLKVTETWFSANERSIAWTTMLSTVDFGVCVISLIYPRIMKTIPQIQILGYINIGTIIVTSFVCLTCLTTDAPKNPPSQRQVRANREKDMLFKTAMKRLIFNKDVLLHLMHLGISEACTMAVSSVFQRILINAGHSTIFAGSLMSSNSFVSLIMLIVMSSFVNRARQPILICKLSSMVQTVFHIVFMVVLMNKMPRWSVITISIVNTICKSWSLPNFTNITADLAAGLVPQATIVGFSITLTVLTMTVINITFGSLIVFYGEGRDQVSDYTRSLIFISIVNGINEVIYQLFFHGRSAKEQTNETTSDQNQQESQNNSNRLTV